MESEVKDVSAAVARVRALYHLSQSDLAKELGTSQPNVAAWESGRRTPSLQTLERLADRFRIQIAIRPGRKVQIVRRDE